MPNRRPRRAPKPKVEEEITFEESSGNVFADLGLPNPEERLAKAMLSRIIHCIIQERGWTQRHAAEVLGVSPPDVSDLVRGKLARFSQERLARFLNALDMDVRIQVGPRPAWKEQASVSVEMVARF